jgi:hypothetical protein
VEGISRILRVSGAALALAALLVLSGAASASNNAVFPDPVGDYQQAASDAYASDITQVQVTSADNGDTRISTTLADGVGRMLSGDELDVFIDVDRNNNTGQDGYDIVLIANGGTSAATFQLCRFTQPLTCEAGLEGFGADRPAGTGAHVVEFNLRTASAGLEFYVVSSFPRPGGGNRLFDRAPDAGASNFDIRADGDADGVHGYLDLCPRQGARGVNDANHNGCPGLFNFIKAFRRQVAVPFPGYLQLRKLSFEGPIPPGAKAVISGAGRQETRTTSRGSVRSNRFAGRLPYGARIVVRITKPGWIGFYAEYKVTRGGGLVAKRQACIAAFGSQKPTRCSTSLRGR